MEVWSGENLCIVASKLGIPLAFDSFIEEMCLNHKGRNAYARMLTEMSADIVWKNSIDICTWYFVTEKAISQCFHVEYAWNPSRCSHCKVFGHEDKVCAAAMKVDSVTKEGEKIDNNKEIKGKTVMDEEGFVEVYKKKR